MSQAAQMAGGPLDGQTIELRPVQEQNGEYGVLVGRDTNRGDPAYARDELGQWIWQGKPWPAHLIASTAPIHGAGWLAEQAARGVDHAVKRACALSPSRAF
ncbi:hypothetical protein ACFVUQ_34635 [Streptomyces cyaneofuscatus]|uniref:hypothetical protein n=1 Tax=Streptomyces cyaneofuscatus TaxID=66883 RepID=UPI0036DC8D14